MTSPCRPLFRPLFRLKVSAATRIITYVCSSRVFVSTASSLCPKQQQEHSRTSWKENTPREKNNKDKSSEERRKRKQKGKSRGAREESAKESPTWHKKLKCLPEAESQTSEPKAVVPSGRKSGCTQHPPPTGKSFGTACTWARGGGASGNCFC